MMTIRKTCSFLLILTLLATLTISALGGEDRPDLPVIAADAIGPMDTIFDKHLKEGQVLHFTDKYPESVVLFDSLKTVYPNHPAPYFYVAACYQGWMNTYRFNAYQSKLEENVEKAIEIGEARLKEGTDDPWLYFYIGAAYGYRAFYKMAGYNFLGAYRDGKKGIDRFETMLDESPDAYDVYLGLGSYHYWRTARSKFIRIIAFWMKDKRDVGIEQIEIAVKHGRYAGPEATLALLVSLFDYEKYDKAYDVLQRFYRNYPDYDALSVSYYAAYVQMKHDDWGKAAELFTAILAKLDAAPYSAIGYQVECLYWLAKIKEQNGDYAGARKLSSEAMKRKETRDSSKELESPFLSYDDLKSNLETLHEELGKKVEQK